MTDEQVEKLLTEEFGHCCNYCERYDAMGGECEWDNEPQRPDDGERCILFGWDDTAKKLLSQEYEMQTQQGKVKSIWTKWLMKTN